MTNEPWYAAKALFHHKDAGKYEERIVLITASGFDEAEKRCAEEAEEYTSNLNNVDYVGCIDVFHLFDNSISDQTEVYSAMFSSKLSPDELLKSEFIVARS